MTFRNKLATGCGVFVGLGVASFIGIAIGIWIPPLISLTVTVTIIGVALYGGFPELLALFLLSPIILPIGSGMMVRECIRGDGSIENLKCSTNGFISKIKSFFKKEKKAASPGVQSIQNDTSNTNYFVKEHKNRKLLSGGSFLLYNGNNGRKDRMEQVSNVVGTGSSNNRTRGCVHRY